MEVTLVKNDRGTVVMYMYIVYTCMYMYILYVRPHFLCIVHIHAHTHVRCI